MNSFDSQESEKRGWAQNELEQLRHFRSLSLREKLTAVHEMCQTAEALEGMRQRKNRNEKPNPGKLSASPADMGLTYAAEFDKPYA